MDELAQRVYYLSSIRAGVDDTAYDRPSIRGRRGFVEVGRRVRSVLLRVCASDDCTDYCNVCGIPGIETNTIPIEGQPQMCARV